MQWIKRNNEKSLWFLWLPFVIAIGIWSMFHSTAIAETSIEDEEVRLIIHNWEDRPISWFSVNGMMGPNASAYKYNPHANVGGAITCCGIIKGKVVIVKWTLGVKGSQYDAGIRPENYQMKVILPERKAREKNLHVHFLPMKKIKLEWSSKISSSYNPFDEAKGLMEENHE
ncbi:MAG: DUF3304 domain-containing protein [Providencia rustigianii]|uniref:DUF3304 domain-containing protein n=1 Tax=Providencia rustigianii TaxID=158850 RepID=UPI003F3AF721